MFIALRDIRFARGRFALMGSVVALITLLVVLLSGLTTGLAGENISAVENPRGDRIAFGSEKISFSGSTVTAAQWKGLGGQPLGITQTRLTHDGADQAVAVFGSESLGPVRRGDGELAVSPDLGLAVGDTVTIGGRPYRVTALEQLQVMDHMRGERSGKAADLLRAVGLDGKENRRPHQLSGGERQRVNIARALMSDPSVLLVDEPASALDHARGTEVMRLLAELTGERAVATLLVTHDVAQIGHAHRVTGMDDGRLSERLPGLTPGVPATSRPGGR
ncbi:ATP-binding cassette domain-containing protein [Streptosporangium roseum]|uniref:ATP-binding cassette domain-containing protein n=1 Tax=Streptosporangium roseum TaxID=2001 RepID=UPI00068FB3FE|nr:ATP-binding cassette domain-containing protein [Streptosporangium roseum]